MTATMTRKSSPESAYRPLAIADLGNRYLKWIDARGAVHCIPSCIKELEDWEDAEADERTIILEVANRRYAIGQQAKSLGGWSMFSEQKTDWAWLIGLVALEPNPGESSVLIETLRYAIPDIRNKESLMAIKRLEGVHDFRLNGKDMIATVRRVEPWDETKAAYRYVSAKGLFKYPGMVNGILAIGGGTANASLFSPEGTMLRSEDVVTLGTFALAEKISAALNPSLGYRADASLIMDAIENGSYRYGHPTEGPYFEPQYIRALESTIQEIRQKLKTAWAAKLAANQIGEVIIVGGSAPLLEQLEVQTKGRFKIIQSEGQSNNFPQLVTLYGMAL